MIEQRIALGISYQGTHYHGFQSQPIVPTIQEALEEAISSVANHAIRIFTAGRTDRGVHATGQVIHFDTRSERQEKAWVSGVNALLPDDICVTWMRNVPPEFDARRSATSRRYQYWILNEALRQALGHAFVAREHRPLDAQVMHDSAQALIGEQDFSAFRAAHCQSLTPWRCVEDVRVFRRGKMVVLDITANAFLHHMVRNIAGALIEVGSGAQDVGWIAHLLAARDRRLAGKMASGAGLYLKAVQYPAHFGLPVVELQGDAQWPFS
ncbi:MAG: tRNA pseudouridine(38-40) synthase TruA [Pseudomonadales bacterium]